MSWLTALFGGSNPIKDFGDAADKMFTTDEERLKFRNELVQLESKLELALHEQYTERWKADMTSDNKLSKNVRPGTWIAITVLLILTVGIDALWVKVDPATKQLVQMAWITITGLYVPAREIGKYVRGKK